MSEFYFRAKVRDLKQKPVGLRNQGMIPGIVYGVQNNTQPILLDKKQGEVILQKSKEAAVFLLEIEGEKEKRNVLIQEIQKNKLSSQPIHFDFLEIDLTKEIETEVPLVFKGVSLAVKDLGGILVKNLERISVRCLPKKLPQEIVVDLESLKHFGDDISVVNLPLLEGVTYLNKKSAIIASVIEPRSEEEIKSTGEENAVDVTKVEGVADKEPVVEEKKEGDNKKEEKK